MNFLPSTYNLVSLSFDYIFTYKLHLYKGTVMHICVNEANNTSGDPCKTNDLKSIEF